MVEKNDVIGILSIRPCTLIELCNLFKCSKNRITNILFIIPDLNFQANYYYVGDLTEVIHRFIFYTSPVFISYVQTRTSELIKELVQLPQNWAWLPREEREPLLESAYTPFNKIISAILV